MHDRIPGFPRDDRQAVPHEVQLGARQERAGLHARIRGLARELRSGVPAAVQLAAPQPEAVVNCGRIHGFPAAYRSVVPLAPVGGSLREHSAVEPKIQAVHLARSHGSAAHRQADYPGGLAAVVMLAERLGEQPAVADRSARTCDSVASHRS